MADRADSGGSPVPHAQAMTALARFALHSPAISTLEDLLDAVVEVAISASGADSVHVGRIDRPHGRLQILRNAGRVADWELESPSDESYLVADYPQLSCTAEHPRSWHGNVDDDTTSVNDRILLAKQGKAHAMSVPVILPGDVWGELFLTRLQSRAFSDADEAVAVVIAGLAAAVLARVLGDQRLRELAYNDALTGLANRRAADEQLEAWASHPTDAAELTVVLCDVNGLKLVNDTHGHLVGDRLIQDVARHVSAAAGRLPRGLAARVGGDEFLIATPCRDQALVTRVVKELTEDAARLPYGGGLSCGTAWAGALLKPEPSPQSLVRSLLRISDSEQYRRKVATRGPVENTDPGACKIAVAASGRTHRDAVGGSAKRSPHATHPITNPVTGVTTAAIDVGVPQLVGQETLTWLTDLDESTPVQDRLAHAARTVCELAGGAAWFVSAVDAQRGTVRAVSCGTTRSTEVTDGLWPSVELDPHVYLLRDFAATERVVREQDVLCADTFTGDPAERQLLIQDGFQTMIAAGGIDSDSGGWLIEIYGDSLTRNLHASATLLHIAIGRAVTSRRGDGAGLRRAADAAGTPQTARV